MLSEVWYNYGDGDREKAFSYTYTASGDLYKFTDHRQGISTVYKYDTTRRLTSVIEYDEDDMTHRFSTGITYDEDGRVGTTYYDIVTPIAGSTSNFEWSYQYFYNNDGSLKKLNVRTDATNGNLSYTYDDFGRLTSKTNYHYKSVNSIYYSNEVDYTYRTYSTDHTDNLVSSYTSTVNDGTGLTYTYTYDSANNITKIEYSTGEEIRYYYDELSQLIREDNELTGKTYVYEYDTSGNILTKKVASFTNADTGLIIFTSIYNYSYSGGAWGDQLASYRGQTITYDAIGNPLSYYNGQRYTFTWDGRRMSTATVGGVTYTFTYNDDGLVTSKSYGNTTIQYFYNGSLLTAELCDDYLIVYMYDESGAPIGMTYRGASYAAGVWDVYWYEKNLQGDIVAIYNDAGTKLVSYTYDAWGNFTVTGHNGGQNSYARFNPFTYRGYYYDDNFELYRTGTRYYDPRTGRFISPDSFGVITATPDGLTDKNLYAYCDNNPVMRADQGGEFWWVIGAIVGVAAQYVSDVISNVVSGETGIDILKPSSSAAQYAAAAASGALATTGINLAGSSVANAVIEGTANLIDQAVEGDGLDVVEFVISVSIGAASGRKGIDASNLSGVYKRSKQVLESALSPKKTAMYTDKINDVKTTIAKKVAGTLGGKVIAGLFSGFF